MPRRDDIQTILLIGSGPIVIGQACEFDYSGTQACKALRAEGYRIVLLNSNPATIMTDPEFADRTYIEPISPEFVEKILHEEQSRGYSVDALLPTLGGQTALNCAMEVADRGILQRYSVRLIGASREAIEKAEDRRLFHQAMVRIGLDVPQSGTAHSLAEAEQILELIGLPCCVRPAYTLGGEGGGFCQTREKFDRVVTRGLERSRIREVLIEESLYGWKEFELEVICDAKDNFIVVCSIENLDPMGVHTGDSITVAPAQTLTDREYQKMRNSAKAIVREIGINTGGCNVQFAVDQRSGRQTVIEMNPRVSRSSALASKATGYPIAKVAAKLAVGYTLDEISNDITGTTAASFEPVLDYCVVKMPRWAFEKFPDVDETLDTHMKSVGEGMAIGRTFQEAWQKCIRSMEIQRAGYGLDKNDKWLTHSLRQLDKGLSTTDCVAHSVQNELKQKTGQPGTVCMASQQHEPPADVRESSVVSWPIQDRILQKKLIEPCQGRPYYIRYALKLGWTVEKIHQLTGIDRWFLAQMCELVAFEDKLVTSALAFHHESGLPREVLHQARFMGYNCDQLACLLELSSAEMSQIDSLHKGDCFKIVDTCSAEFTASTPYYYSTYEEPVAHTEDGKTVFSVDNELDVKQGPHVIILGGGPNRIGQGIEFDYCCVHACHMAQSLGFRTVMINSNPETVSTDYDTSDMLFFEPLTREDVLRVVHAIMLRGTVRGVVIQFGGQTPLNLAHALAKEKIPILGTPPSSIELAENRESFQNLLSELGLKQPPNGVAHTPAEARTIAHQLGYPVLIRPSYVLGGRAMRLCNNDEDLRKHVISAFIVTDRTDAPTDQHNVLVDKFILDATEIDVDAVADYQKPNDPRGECVICGVMEHIEEAGIHSGDSTCALPPHSLSPRWIREIESQTCKLAHCIGVCGLINVQFAVSDETLYVLEVNPRGSRTVPFVSKATGVPWAQVALSVMLGRKLRDVLWEMGVGRMPRPIMQAIKAPVFPFDKFPGSDMILGPEMRSTGEVMGIDKTFGLAFAKAAIATGLSLPTHGNALVSVNDPDKPRVAQIAADLKKLGFKLFATIGTHRILQEAGIDSVVVSKQAGAPEGFLLDLINHGVLDLLINTPVHYGPAWQEGRWRAAATVQRIPLITTLPGARAAVEAIRAMKDHKGREILTVRALQDYVIPVV